MTWDDDRFIALGLLPPVRRTPVPDGPQDMVSILDHALSADPGGEALVGRFSRLTFQELEAAVNAAAAVFQDHGLVPGDRIAACAPNHPELVVAFLAAQRIGAVWVGVNRVLAPPEKLYILQDCGASLVLSGADTVGQFRALQADCPCLRTVLLMEAGDPGCEFSALAADRAGVGRPGVAVDPFAPAAISYTSGTTGQPKGVVHSQHNMVVPGAAARGNGIWHTGRRRGVALALTITNNMILNPVVAFMDAAACICMDRIDTPGFVEWIRSAKAEAVSAVPTVVYDLLSDPALKAADLASLVALKTGGTAIADALRRRFRDRFGIVLQTTYGLTEAPTIVAESEPGTIPPPGAVGRVLPHLVVAVADGQDQPVAAGQIGEVVVRAAQDGPWAHVYTPALGYWNRPEATAALLRNGWLHTGDLGALDEAGFLSIKDRKNDLIIRGGSNIYPAEVENVIQEDSRVGSCVVLGIPDERLGERVLATVQLAEGQDPSEALREELRLLCARNLARYKVPSEWAFLPEFPRNAMGKVNRRELRRMVEAGPARTAPDGRPQ